MEPYLFYGLILPERAHFSLTFDLKFNHLVSGIDASARVSIVLNQVAVWVDSEHEWDVVDLRNVVKNIVQGHMAMIGYLKGYAYDLEITRVLSPARGVDYVFGIDTPCITDRNQAIDLNEALLRLREKTIGENGVYIGRCFGDLVSAMKHPDDTGFYCYRAIESLRHHCASMNDLREAPKARQWQKFREVSGIDEEFILKIKRSADPLRHGDFNRSTAINSDELFKSTWAIIDAYLAMI